MLPEVFYPGGGFQPVQDLTSGAEWGLAVHEFHVQFPYDLMKCMPQDIETDMEGT